MELAASPSVTKMVLIVWSIDIEAGSHGFVTLILNTHDC